MLSFIATTWVLAMLPGVGQALMLRQTLADGPRVAIATISGTVSGLVLWSAAAGAGLSTVLLGDPVFYRALLLAGGAFLVVIGLRTVWRALQGAHEEDEAGRAASRDPDTPVTRKAAFATGLMTNLGNPKAGVFAISLLPAFAGVGGFLPTVGLGVVWAAVTACWYLLFVLLVSRGRTFMTRPGARRALTGTSGAVLVAVGVAVALG